MKKAISFLLGVILILTPVFGISLSTSFLDDYDAIESASNSVLYLETDDDYDSEFYTSGSGFVAFNNQTFVTNYHVVEDAVTITVYDEDYNKYKVGKILVTDKERDIAIISFQSPTNLKPLKLADRPVLKRGQPIATIGYPKGLFNTFSTGIISAIIDFDNRREIQFTAPISHGSSGGALFNENGEVIGITSSTVEEGQNINFAVDISHAIAMYKQYDSDYVLPKITQSPISTVPPIKTTKLKPPSVVAALFSGNSIMLAWTIANEAISYNIFRATEINGDYTFIGETTNTRFTDSKICSGITYFYKIESVGDSPSDRSELSEYSMETVPAGISSVPTPPSPTPKPTEKPKLSAPNNITVTAIGKTVIISWDAVKGAERYKIYRSSTSDRILTLIGLTETTSYIDTSVMEGKTYYYAVASSNIEQGFSNKSNEVSIFVSKATASPSPLPSPKPIPSPTPAPISFITQEEIAKYKTLKVGMNDPDVARLKERMYELGYFSNKTVNNSFTETTAEYVKEFQRANGLKADGIATPEMQALFFSQYAIPKPTATPKPSPTPSPTPRLSKPTNVKASIIGTTVTITWKEVPGATEYKVYRSNQSSEFLKLINEYSLLATVTVNKYVDTNTNKGDTYHYKVESVNGKNVSDKSSLVKVVMPKATPTPYLEPEYPLVIGDYAYWNEHSSYVSFNPKVTNTSKKSTIDGFTITFYCENVYNERITYSWTSGYYSEAIYSKTIKPNSSTFVGYTDITGYNGIEYIYAAVTKMHTTDGRTITIPESDWDWHYNRWKIE